MSTKKKPEPAPPSMRVADCGVHGEAWHAANAQAFEDLRDDGGLPEARMLAPTTVGDDVPRRNCLDRSTPAELAIRAAVDAVEALPAHPLLTEAVTLLDQARHKVADFVDLPSHTKKDA